MTDDGQLLSNAEAFIQSDTWYERAELDLLVPLLRGVQTFVDVGASIGPYSARAAECLRNARIVSLEPHPQTFVLLSKRVEQLRDLCEARGNRIEPLNLAASNMEGTVDFYLSKSDVLISALQPLGTESTKVAVRVTTLDQLFPDAPPDFVKLDVEGFEWRVLDGCAAVHRKGKTRFLIEIHPWGDPGIQKRPSDVLSFMSNHGYGIRRIHRHWLFEPGAATLRNRSKSRAYGFILDRPALRRVARKVIEAFAQHKSATPNTR